MKDRIRQIMEAQHMTQQVFAQFIEMAPATLSSIFNDRTKPTLNIVEAIKKKIPDISTDWLMFGRGPMYVTSNSPASPSPDGVATGADGHGSGRPSNSSPSEIALSFDDAPSSFPTPQEKVFSGGSTYNGVKGTRLDSGREEQKFFDKPQRRVIEIRVFYDDQTWDTFVPAKR